jgi:hypothetical protein
MSMRSLMLPATILTFVALAACSGAPGPGGDGSATASEGTTGDDASTTATTGGGPGTDPTTTAGSASGTATGEPGACGDGEIDAGESCDGAELGGKTCADVDPAYSGGSLACAANCMSFDASGCELAPGTALVALNEIGSDGAKEGEWSGKGDVIELYNAGDVAADLSGYKLSDDPTLPADKTYVFADGTTLAPGAWLVLVELDDVTMMGDFPFGIAQDKDETLTLADAGGQVVDTITFAGADAAVSYCRLPDGSGAWSACAQTFGAANAATSGSCGDGVECDVADLGGATCQTLGFQGGTLACTADCKHDTSACESGSELVINELESANDDIELYNAGNAPVDISGWILTDDVVDQMYDPMADAEKLTFAAQTTIPAKGFLVVAKGMDPGQHPFGLGGDGDTVTLLKPNLEVVDQVSYGAMEADVSYCRLPDGPGGAWMPLCTPTLGDPNAGG